MITIKKFLFIVSILFCLSIFADNQTNPYQPVNAVGLDEVRIANEINEVITVCSHQANTETKRLFKNFDQNQYSKNPNYKVVSDIGKTWHYYFLNAFITTEKNRLENKLENNILLLGEYARIIVAVKNHVTTITRNHMSDLQELVEIRKNDLDKYQNQDGPSFEYLLKEQAKIQAEESEKNHPGKPFDETPVEDGGDFNLDQAYRNIINSLTKINLSDVIIRHGYIFLKRIFI